VMHEFAEVLDKEIRPYLREHHGDIEIVDFKAGILTVRLLGSCSGCPGSHTTVKEVVEKGLKSRFNVIERVVVAENEIDAEVWAFAKKILSSVPNKA